MAKLTEQQKSARIIRKCLQNWTENPEETNLLDRARLEAEGDAVRLQEVSEIILATPKVRFEKAKAAIANLAKFCGLALVISLSACDPAQLQQEAEQAPAGGAYQHALDVGLRSDPVNFCIPQQFDCADPVDDIGRPRIDCKVSDPSAIFDAADYAAADAGMFVNPEGYEQRRILVHLHPNNVISVLVVDPALVNAYQGPCTEIGQ